MDVEGGGGGSESIDIASDLLQQFQCLATQDKDVLIKEFQKLLSPVSLPPEGCEFFLDMNNWNLQQAICSYFDLDAHNQLQRSLPAMTFIKDVTIGEGEEVPPNTRFIKTWKMQNCGPERWPPGCILKFVAGDQLSSYERVIVESLDAGQISNVSIEMSSPCKPGIYQGQWRMSTATGQYFGEVIWVIITVAEGGLLGLTQQMDSFHSLGSPIKNTESMNPFGCSANFQTNEVPTTCLDRSSNLNGEMDEMSGISSLPRHQDAFIVASNHHQPDGIHPLLREDVFGNELKTNCVPIVHRIENQNQNLVNPVLNNGYRNHTTTENSEETRMRPTTNLPSTALNGDLPPTPPSEDMVL